MTDDQQLHDQTNRVRLDAFERRMDRFEERLEENTQTTNSVKEGTDFLVEIMQAFRGLAKVLTWCGKVFKPVATTVAAAASAYFAWKHNK